MSLKKLILYVTLIAGINMVITMLSANNPENHPTYEVWITQNHSFLLMFLTGVDMVVVSLILLAHTKN